MDFGPEPPDHDERPLQFGRRLFVLAWHLTGDGPQAEALAQESLVRSLLSPGFPDDEMEAELFLCRALIQLWRERPAAGGRKPGAGPDAPRPAGTATGPVGVPRTIEAGVPLRRLLARLSPLERAVLILRVAEGLDYEAIGRVLDMQPEVVFARLRQARAALRDEDEAIPETLSETMSRYLDDRLETEWRAAFESRIRNEPPLRERVEFHRGLTLDLREDAPPLPRDFIARLRDRLERTQETLALVDREAAGRAGDETPPSPREPSVSVEPIRDAAPPPGPAVPRPPAARPEPPAPRRAGLVTGGALLLIAGVTIGLWVARRPATSRAPEGEAGIAAVDGAPGRAVPQGTPDAATTDALRSLGYLAPGKNGSTGDPGGAKPAGIETPWRTLPVAAAPPEGQETRVIRSKRVWASLFGSPETASGVSFERDMVVLVRASPAAEPRARLVVTSVRTTAEALVVECRREQRAAAAVGLAIVVPITDQPVRLVVR